MNIRKLNEIREVRNLSCVSIAEQSRRPVPHGVEIVFWRKSEPHLGDDHSHYPRAELFAGRIAEHPSKRDLQLGGDQTHPQVPFAQRPRQAHGGYRSGRRIPPFSGADVPRGKINAFNLVDDIRQLSYEQIAKASRYVRALKNGFSE